MTYFYEIPRYDISHNLRIWTDYVIFSQNLFHSIPRGLYKQHCAYLLQRWNIFVLAMETKGFFQFEIIINVLVSSFCFIWIHNMLWVYDHYKYFDLRSDN